MILKSKRQKEEEEGSESERDEINCIWIISTRFHFPRDFLPRFSFSSLQSHFVFPILLSINSRIIYDEYETIIITVNYKYTYAVIGSGADDHLPSENLFWSKLEGRNGERLLVSEMRWDGTGKNVGKVQVGRESTTVTRYGFYVNLTFNYTHYFISFPLSFVIIISFFPSYSIRHIFFLSTFNSSSPALNCFSSEGRRWNERETETWMKDCSPCVWEQVVTVQNKGRWSCLNY